MTLHKEMGQNSKGYEALEELRIRYMKEELKAERSRLEHLEPSATFQTSHPIMAQHD